MNIDSLPLEVISVVTKWLNISDILRLQVTCKSVQVMISPPFHLSFRPYKESWLHFNTSSLKQKFNQMIRLDSSDAPTRKQLIFLARHGHLDLLRILAEYIYDDHTIQELFTITTFHSEYYHGKISLYLLKLDPNLNINLPSHPLISASKAGNPDLVEFLLTFPIPSSIISTSLTHSIRHNNPSCLKALLDHTPPTIKDLELSAFRGHYKITKLILLFGLIPNENSLILAVEGGYLLITIILLSHNPFLKLTQALYVAHVNSHEEVTRYLYDRSTAFEKIKFVVKIGNHGILKRLLKEVDEVDEQEGVLVRIAVKYGQKECLRVLLEDGRVDPGHRGNEALDMARKRGEWEMVGMLEEDCRVVERERSKNVVPEKWVRA